METYCYNYFMKIKKIFFLFTFFLCFIKLSALSPEINKKYILCFPDNFENFTEEQKSSTPLIIMLHGANGNAEGFMNETQFHKQACREGYTVAYINGPAEWHFYNAKQSKKDVKFILKTAHTIQKKYGLSTKLYAAGFSNGAFMVHQLASQYSKYFTAAASVGGMMPKPVWEKRASKIDINFLQINGTKDDVVPMKCNDTAKYNPNPAIEDVIDYYKSANGNPDKIQWILVENGRHSWPKEDFSALDANTEILKFFK